MESRALPPQIGWAVVGQKNEAGGGGETGAGSFSQYVVHVGTELTSSGVVGENFLLGRSLFWVVWFREGSSLSGGGMTGERRQMTGGEGC